MLRRKKMQKVYLDNAATSWPKPPVVLEAMMDYMQNIGCSPNRGNYQCSLQAARILLTAREKIAAYYNSADCDRVIFTANATQGINQILKGLLKSGDHVITSSLEHNAVIRPLRGLALREGVEIDIVQFSPQGTIDPLKFAEKIKKNTKLIVINHASNLIGTFLPVTEISKIAQREKIFLAVDAAQTAGIHPLDFDRHQLDALIFTGHKGLLGPSGTGGLILSSGLAERLTPLLEGGTGSSSDQEYQVEFCPDKFESGTLNFVGIAGLLAGLNFIMTQGQEKITEHINLLGIRLWEGLKAIKGLKVLGPPKLQKGSAVFSCDLLGAELSSLAFELDQKYNILVRSGLHCCPLGHKTLQTYPRGTIRFSPGYFNTVLEIDYTLNALEQLKKNYY